jgi:threonine dehydrogenase-like Zn-dependent dehydrogenase
MIACLFDGREVRVDRNHPEPEAPPGEVRVAVRLAGVCRTDLEIARGYMGFKGVLGHEFVGTALEGRLKDRRVVGDINCVCGQCDMCRRGLPTHCRRRTTLGIDGRDGAFAERLALPEANLVPVPDKVPDRAAVFAEPLAAAIQITRQVDLAPEQHIVILGDGRLGQLVARVFRARGLSPTVVGKSPGKMDLVRRLGLEAVAADDALPDKAADVVVEATGTADGLATALWLVRPRGTIALKSTVADTAGLNLAPLVVDEVTVVGSRCGPMDAAVAMLAQGDLALEPLVTAEYPLTEADAAIRVAGDPEAIKVLIRS